MFIYPAQGKITSRFGKDFLHGVARIHNGIDIAQNGTVKLVAAASGMVSRSYRSSSYGEVVFIVHSLNGETYETVYAHMRSGSRKVCTGDSSEARTVPRIYGKHRRFYRATSSF